jgi:hypothetical protein
MQENKIIIGYSNGTGSAQAFIPERHDIRAHLGRNSVQAIERLKSANPDIFTKDVEISTQPFQRLPPGIKFA